MTAEACRTECQQKILVTPDRRGRLHVEDGGEGQRGKREGEDGTKTLQRTDGVNVAKSSRITRHRTGGVASVKSSGVVLPTYGHVFKVRGHIQDPTDKKADRLRPAVVVGVPVDLDGRIRIVTRTSNVERKGIASPPDPALGLDLPGVWGFYRSVDARLWLPPDVKHVGILEADVLEKICKAFGIQGRVS